MSPQPPPEAERDSAARSAVIFGALALACALLLAGWWASRTWLAARALRDAPPQLADAQEPGAPIPGAGPGSVRVRVVDAASGAPLEGIEVELLSEEPVRRRFGSRSSDARGELRFEAVYAPIVIAHTRRDERFAACATLVQGERDAERTALLRLGSGARIRGRIVDDLGAPVEDASIALPDISPWPDPTRAAPLVARSASDGSYTIERVGNLPRAITPRESGGHFAAALSQVLVEASRAGSVARLPASVLPCDDARLADLVLARPPSFAGRVLDAQGRPQAGVLLSLDPRRARLSQLNLHVVDPAAVAEGLADLPGSPRFRLLECETLSDANGEFLLRATPSRPTLLLATPDGRLSDEPLGEWEAGVTSAGLQFVLADREVLRLRLSDVDGAPILGASLAQQAAGGERAARVMPLDGPRQAAWTSSKVELAAQLADGQTLRLLAAPLGDGSYAFALPAPLSAIERFDISAPGFKTRVREVHGRLRSGLAIADERLERMDTLALRVVIGSGFDEAPGSEPQELQLRLCGLEPQPVVSELNPQRAACCGYGMSLTTTLLARETRLDVPIPSDRPLWVYARTWRGRRAEELVLGPIAPGPEPHELEIPALPPGPSPFDAPLRSAGRRDPREGREVLAASLCAFDARDAKGLGDAQVWAVCDPLGAAALEARTWFADEAGCVLLDDLVEGTWSFVVAAEGHVATSLGPFELLAANAPMGEYDLGAVQLEPLD